MKSNLLNLFNMNGIGIASIVVSLIAGLLIYFVLSEKNFPIITNAKCAFFILWIIGLVMSILAGFRDAPDGNFNIPKLLLYLLMFLGVLAFILLVVMVIGIKVPMISKYQEAFFVLAMIIGFKWAVVQLYRLYQWII